MTIFRTKLRSPSGIRALYGALGTYPADNQGQCDLAVAEIGEKWPSVLIVGTARDCASQLAGSIEQLGKAFERCASVQWLVIESDSSDATVDILRGLADADSNFAYRSLGNLRLTVPLRTDRLAKCRNVCIAEVIENPLYRDVDLIVVADLDGVNNLLSPAAVATCWARDDWDVATANQLGPYYDVWALRHPIWSPNDCWAQHRWLSQTASNDREQAMGTAVFGRMIRIAPDREWIEVDSAFGGLGLYRREAFIAALYQGLDDNGVEVCEHVAFHRALRAKGKRIFVNPGLINTDFTELTQQLRFRSQIFRAPLRILRSIRASL